MAIKKESWMYASSLIKRESGIKIFLIQKKTSQNHENSKSIKRIQKLNIFKNLKTFNFIEEKY